MRLRNQAYWEGSRSYLWCHLTSDFWQVTVGQILWNSRTSVKTPQCGTVFLRELSTQYVYLEDLALIADTKCLKICSELQKSASMSMIYASFQTMVLAPLNWGEQICNSLLLTLMVNELTRFSFFLVCLIWLSFVVASTSSCVLFTRHEILP